LTCHGSGLNFKNYAIWWYRQAPGDKFDSDQGTTKRYGEAVQGRAMASRDNSQSKSFLELQDLRPQDSAQYFCAI
ncbi:HVC33 protein, partial [Zapornia atra]|nr:HVC33 protein [Zapornia atra]